MAGFVVAAAGDARKIKGGRWTVARFFLVSVAFTSAWLAVSSQLDYYKKLHGPQLNIAYYLPSIPLLVISALLDKPLEARLGVARTILVRLLLGLLGYGAVSAWFPFMPPDIWFLLSAVVALGLFSGIVFSASYQLVARFANKNVIALGLGCSASGPLVLALQLALRVDSEPSRMQQVLLYETITLVIVAGLWATISLLVRHWGSIEAHASKAGLSEPLLQQQAGQDSSAPAAPPPLASEESSLLPLSSPAQRRPPLSPHGGGTPLLALGATVWRQRSVPPLAQYNSLEPYQTFLSTDQEAESAASLSWDVGGLLAAAAAVDGGGNDAELGGGGRLERQLSAPSLVLLEGAAAAPDSPSKRLAGGGASSPGATSGSHQAAAAAAIEVSHAAEPQAPPSDHGASWQALRLVWAPVAALMLSSTIALTLFPFFTYVPTSGLLGDSLPRVLFFGRIFSDVLGRFLPRLPALAATSPLAPLAVAGVKLLGVPITLLYLKSPDWMHSDVAAVTFICAVWLLGGYINTMANIISPRLVPPHLKGSAAGVMAIAYQVAHFLGLALATLLVYLLYGKIGVE